MFSIKKRFILFTLLSLVTLSVSAKMEKMLQVFRDGDIIKEFAVDEIDHIEVNDQDEKVVRIFRNGEVIAQYGVGDIDYVEVNERLVVPENIPEDEIWYETEDGTIYDPTDNIYARVPFDRSVVSNKYYGDHGVIKLDGSVKEVYSEFTIGNFRCHQLTAVYLPDCVEYIGPGAFNGNKLRTFRVPANLREMGGSPFYQCENLNRFTGSHISDDGRCLILNDCIYAFVPKGKKHYRTPAGVKSIDGNAFTHWSELESIEFNEGVQHIGSILYESQTLKRVTFPSTLIELGEYAFRECLSMEGFYGNERFHTQDNLCLISYPDNPKYPGPWIAVFAGKGLSSYTIPEGIVGIGARAFFERPELKSITLPESLKIAQTGCIVRCPNIESVMGYHTTADHRCIVVDGELQNFVARKGITSYRVPDEVTVISAGVFQDSLLEEISMSDNVITIWGQAFAQMPNLKKLTLSASLQHIKMYNPFYDDSQLKSIYMRSPLPPSYSDGNKGTENPNIYVPEQTYQIYANSPNWMSYGQNFKAYQYEDLEVDRYLPDYYFSTDYSKHGTVEQLVTATEGNGVDIVLMGDGFTDRQIADGTYRTAMQTIVRTLFEEEPYKSFKRMFNVYMVNVVSQTEGYDRDDTALGGFFGGGTYVGGNDARCFQFAQKAISADRMDEALIIVAMNKDAYAGTCFMYAPSGAGGDYGSGTAVAYFPMGANADTNRELVLHEALGHGFAKLDDEYAYDYNGEIPHYVIAEIKKRQNEWGWSKNVDFTSDLSAIRWGRFVSDARYSKEKIGAYEGASTYSRGVWRPTEKSIMLDNLRGFNAPSREAIYYRIHKLAYGEGWTYNYEDFVNYDVVNRNKKMQSNDREDAQTRRAVLPAPVVVGKSWRDVVSEIK